MSREQCHACTSPAECDKRRSCQRLRASAERLYPASPYLQAELLRAISVVRNSPRGWVCDHPLGRQEVTQ